ncbi:MAG: RNA polymerase sigma factor [Bacteroidetes bacterium]|jgi:RNA polymerase sigma factor (sigma-70 family)|nr:RNA polymerase sigma factor [Bacteroidota bacterium]MBT3749987.1 RNA polymerase sigma factor [Bacteroidota bacterium]MBT4399007.1 RNA polymerase sigma factor [Bacteroidota bacterium]MBT4409477.1 RNA polymerase sigma factor [Bacteroidota bacterium]MBT5426708.1 RNA polymerase sigma factor [Bacteroidota bacterium]
MTVKDYNHCVDQYADPVYRFILKNIQDEEKARDVVQDTFERLWVNAQKVNSEKAKSYLFTTAYHAMIDKIRKDKRQTNIEQVDQLEYSHNEHYSDLKEILNEAIEKLPDDQRSVVLLRDYEGYSYKEIAEITDLTEAQVKVYIYRARVFLKNYIGSMESVI